MEFCWLQCFTLAPARVFSFPHTHTHKYENPEKCSPAKQDRDIDNSFATEKWIQIEQEIASKNKNENKSVRHHRHHRHFH